jgi:hypothetical protein
LLSVLCSIARFRRRGGPCSPFFFFISVVGVCFSFSNTQRNRICACVQSTYGAIIALTQTKNPPTTTQIAPRAGETHQSGPQTTLLLNRMRIASVLLDGALLNINVEDRQSRVSISVNASPKSATVHHCVFWATFAARLRVPLAAFALLSSTSGASGDPFPAHAGGISCGTFVLPARECAVQFDICVEDASMMSSGLLIDHSEAQPQQQPRQQQATQEQQPGSPLSFLERGVAESIARAATPKQPRNRAIRAERAADDEAAPGARMPRALHRCTAPLVRWCPRLAAFRDKNEDGQMMCILRQPQKKRQPDDMGRGSAETADHQHRYSCCALASILFSGDADRTLSAAQRSSARRPAVACRILAEATLLDADSAADAGFSFHPNEEAAPSPHAPPPLFATTDALSSRTTSPDSSFLLPWPSPVASSSSSSSSSSSPSSFSKAWNGSGSDDDAATLVISPPASTTGNEDSSSSSSHSSFEEGAHHGDDDRVSHADARGDVLLPPLPLPLPPLLFPAVLRSQRDRSSDSSTCENELAPGVHCAATPHIDEEAVAVRHALANHDQHQRAENIPEQPTAATTASDSQEETHFLSSNAAATKALVLAKPLAARRPVCENGTPPQMRNTIIVALFTAASTLDHQWRRCAVSFSTVMRFFQRDRATFKWETLAPLAETMISVK